MTTAGRGRWGARVSRVLNGLATRWATPGAGRVVVCSPIVGFVAGALSVVLLVSLDGISDYVFGEWLHFQTPPAVGGHPRAITSPYPWWLVLLIPTLGGLVCGLIVFTLAPEAEGHGTDSMIKAFHKGGGMIRGRVPIIKGITSLITIGTGGSAGLEGPIGQIGAGFGSLLARLLRLTVSERRLLMLAGAAGGIGSIFRSPLGGALFACEILYSSSATESSALLPCLASSIVAYSTFALFLHPEPVFAVGPQAFHGFKELPAFAILAVVCAGVGWFYVKFFYGVRDYLFNPLPVPRHVKPAIGGLMLGLIALAFPQVLGGGYGWMQWGAIGLPPSLCLPDQAPFRPGMGAGLLFALAILKIIATGLTVSSGGSGGIFGPSVVIGGLLGGAVGETLRVFFPGAESIDPGAFALVGMGGFFAGVSKTPLTSIVMVCEMTGNYSLLVPLMLACGLSIGFSRRWTLYEEQVPSLVDSGAHQGDFVIDVLERLRVREIPMRTAGIELVPESTPFDELLRLVANSQAILYPVVNAEGRMTGILSLRRRPECPAGHHHRPPRRGRRPGQPACLDRHPRRRPAHRPQAPDRTEPRRDPGRLDRRPRPTPRAVEPPRPRGGVLEPDPGVEV